jgi:hypothetical protein
VSHAGNADLGGLRSDLVSVRGELTLLRRMVGFNLAMTVALVAKAFLGGR